jgi:hypothetical protein
MLKVVKVHTLPRLLRLGLLALSFVAVVFIARSRGLLFAYSQTTSFCQQCGSVERLRQLTLLTVSFKSRNCDETLLKRRAFSQTVHSREHRACVPIEESEWALSLTSGFRSVGFPNYWSLDKHQVWHDGPQLPGATAWRYCSPPGFCLHEDDAFAAAFERLANSDAAWSLVQLDAIGCLLARKTFPGSLLQFYTNKNSEAIFRHLQTVDLARTDYSKNWQRNFEDYPVGGTNLWPQGKSVNPLRMRLY